MNEEKPRPAQDDSNPFAEEAEKAQPGFLRQYWDFLRFDRRWWMAPILVLLLLAGAFVILGGTAAAPFIYALF